MSDQMYKWAEEIGEALFELFKEGNSSQMAELNRNLRSLTRQLKEQNREETFTDKVKSVAKPILSLGALALGGKVVGSKAFKTRFPRVARRINSTAHELKGGAKNRIISALEDFL
jgi:hypothetical protein